VEAKNPRFSLKDHGEQRIRAERCEKLLRIQQKSP
jgi:hypothetical protein